jgi:preprotein translocase subunit SecD
MRTVCAVVLVACFLPSCGREKPTQNPVAYEVDVVAVPVGMAARKRAALLRQVLDPNGQDGVRVTAPKADTLRVEVEPNSARGQAIEALLRAISKPRAVIEFRLAARPDPNNPQRWQKYREQIHESGPQTQLTGFMWAAVENASRFFELKEAELAKFDPTNHPLVVAEKAADRYYVLLSTNSKEAMTAIGPWRIEEAWPDTDQHGRPAVRLVLDEIGGALFYRLTSTHIDGTLCALLDGEVIMAATIATGVSRHLQISGDFPNEWVQQTVARLKLAIEGVELAFRRKVN